MVKLQSIAELRAVVETDYDVPETKLRQMALWATSQIDDPEVASELHKKLVDLLEALTFARSINADSFLIRGPVLDIIEQIEVASRRI